MSLTAALGDASKRDMVIDDCVDLVDGEVRGKKGLSGMVIKTGYKAVKGLRPGFIRSVVKSLFDEWAAELDPIWAEAKGRSAFEEQRSRVAEALLKVTDSKSERARSALVKSTYKKLRPTAKKHVEDAVPGLAGLLQKHAGDAS